MIKLKELLSERRTNWLGEAKAADLAKLYKSAEKDLTTYTNKVNRIKRELSAASFGSIQTKMTYFSRDVDKIKEAIIKGIANSKKAGVIETVNESDLGLTLKKGKTITVTHKTSGKELVIIDKPNVRKEYEKIGFFAEGKVNEKVASPFSYHLRNAQEEVEYMLKHGPSPDGDDGVYDNSAQAMKLLSVAQKALGKVK